MASFKTATLFYIGSTESTFSTGYAVGTIQISPTVLKNWLIHSSSDQYASYSLDDAMTVRNNMTVVAGATSVAAIPKYQPVINLPFNLV
jgi:hypothetical protein